MNQISKYTDHHISQSIKRLTSNTHHSPYTDVKKATINFDVLF